MQIDELLRIMVDAKASDLHLKVGNYPMFRINEELTSIAKIAPDWEDSPLSPLRTEEFAATLMNQAQLSRFKETREMDLAYSVSGLGRFRVNILYQRGTVSIAFRSIPFDIPKFEELNVPPGVKDLAEEVRGLVLVTGAAGSGKSTTLAAMIDYINSTRKDHIITIEDPIEFLHRDKVGIVTQREVGMDTLSFSDALRHILRQDPDVVLIGEMRDVETVAAAITAAETGHLVLSTLHTIDAPQTIERIINFFPPYQHQQLRMQLSLLLRGVISQRLLPRQDQKGLIPAVEVMKGTAFVRKLIVENNIYQITNAIAEGAFYGMQTFNQSLASLYQQGRISSEDALAAASNPEELRLAFKGIYSGTGQDFEFENNT
ncbi:TPA: type IV pili twitching motility protein PilT [bacterium]|nr:type IV pili twitching motility protein PilT [bacterium]